MEKVIKLTNKQSALMQSAVIAKAQAEENVNLLGLAFIAGSEYEDLEGGFNFDPVAKTLTLTIPDEPEDPDA